MPFRAFMIYINRFRSSAISCALVCVIGALLTPRGGFGQVPLPDMSPPLPDLNEFLARVKENLESDRLLLSQYTYNMQETRRDLDRGGSVKKTEVRLYEVYPSLDEDLNYQRLVSINGKRLDPKKLEEQDRKYSARVQERARKLAEEHKSDQEQRLAKVAEERQKEQETIEDLFRLYEFVLLGRESIENHPAILIRFTPKPEYKPQTKDGKILKKIRGKVLISESEHQIIRAEAEMTEDLSIGLGLLARVHKGTRLMFVRRKVNDEIWLPAEFHFIGSARALLLKMFRIESTNIFSDYKKFSVTSSYQLLPAKPSQSK